MRRTLIYTVLTGLLLFASACRGGSQLLPADSGSPAQPRTVTLEQAIDEINAAPTPSGVTDDVYAKLKAELVRQLRGRGIGKVVSTPPSGPQNQVTDLRFYGEAPGPFDLKWTYVNRGDCNQDGLVSISDLTPIGAYFNQGVDESNWPAASNADANTDGLVTINDITPLGAHLSTFCAGYNVYGGTSDSGPWVLIGNAPFQAGPGGGPHTFDYTGAGLDSYEFFEVVPVDADGNEGEPSLPSSHTVSPLGVLIGLDQPSLFDGTIDPAGTSLPAVQLPGAANDYIQFDFPPGAVDSPEDIHISTNDGAFIPRLGTFKNEIVSIHTPKLDADGDENFTGPITITVPFDRQDYDNGSAIVPFLVRDDGSLQMIDLVSMNGQFVAKFQTYHLTKHLLWVVQDLNLQAIIGKLRRTAFDPARDGLQVVNTGSMWFPGGECFGMTSFSDWYFYSGEQFLEGDLYPRFMYNVPIYGGLSGQRIICTRAFASITKKWPTYWDTFVGPQDTLNDAWRLLSILCNLSNTGHPVLIDLRHLGGGGGAHSVLAYGYSGNASTIDVYVYNPNTPGVQSTMQFNLSTAHWNSYGGYDSIRYSGPGALWLDEPFDSILEDAKHQFATNGFATLQITSHTNGQSVPAGTVALSGHIESTVVLVTNVQINVGGETYEVPVTPDGDFTANLPIVVGNNPLYFQTWGTAVDNTTPMYVISDAPQGTFSLNGV